MIPMPKIDPIAAAVTEVWGERRWLASPGWGDMQRAESATYAERRELVAARCEVTGQEPLDAAAQIAAQQAITHAGCLLDHPRHASRAATIAQLATAIALLERCPRNQLAPLPWLSGDTDFYAVGSHTALQPTDP